ncbi:DUF1353 domain-containing protein [Luteolibacter arcticus]|uniref:DUF1353 domain-containing protein n=1 Tax=Luteolibacter arcticus TaxID=1581411 RepID=A0ABT3GCH6_9BACT|nr:DUF1353 domain-containing protein [Luteolibacter arcticus]MCW1921331.1 DUF1353 domain-containing protein [Luteolibacter arcticus]
MSRAVFPDPIDVRDNGLQGDVRTFRLLAPFTYLSSRGAITVPAGFVTDGASIPRVFWSVLAQFGPWFGAAIIHDWLYSELNLRFTRLQSDDLFKEAMFNAGLDWPRREMIYRAVRWFGGRSFKGSKP